MSCIFLAHIMVKSSVYIFIENSLSEMDFFFFWVGGIRVKISFKKKKENFLTFPNYKQIFGYKL